MSAAGDAALRCDDYVSAVAHYTAGLDTATKRERCILLTNRSAAFGALGKWREACNDAVDALRISPFYAKALLYRAGAEEQLANGAEALAIYVQILESQFTIGVNEIILQQAGSALVQLTMKILIGSDVRTVREATVRYFNVRRAQDGGDAFLGLECANLLREATKLDAARGRDIRFDILLLEGHRRNELHEYAPAKACYYACIALPEGQCNENARAGIFYRLARLYTHTHDAEHATAVASESYRLYDQADDDEGRARALHAVGFAYYGAHGSCREAERPLQAALELATRQRMTLDEARICSNLALVVIDAQPPQFERACELLRRSSTVLEQLGDLREVSLNMRNLASCCERVGKFAEAEAHIAAAERFSQTEENRVQCALHAARLYDRWKKPERACGKLLAVADIVERKPAYPASFEIALRLWKAYEFSDAGAAETANKYLEKAKTCAMASRNPLLVGELAALRGIAEIGRKNYKAGLQHFNEANASFLQMRIDATTSGDEQVVFWSSIEMLRKVNAYAQFAHVQQGAVMRALEGADWGRSQGLTRKLLMSASNAQSGLSVNNQALRLSKVATILFYSVLREMNALFIWLIPQNHVSSVPVRFAVRPLPACLGGKPVDALSNLNDEHLSAIVSRGSSDPLMRRVPEVDDSEAEQTLQAPMDEDSAQVYYQALIEPVQEWLPPPTTDGVRSRLLIIPHASLFSVPFAALRRGKEHPRIIDRYSLLIAPSIQSLYYMSQQQPLTDRAHRIPEAHFVLAPTVPDGVEWNGIPFEKLPTARAEGEVIAGLIGGELLTDAATKERVLALLPSARIVHIAAHGLRDAGFTDDCIAGALLLANPATGWKRDLASCLLRGSEIQKFNLPNLELVTLACCHSGSGALKAEGVVGLGRAFLFAGARAVVVSMWSVPDTTGTLKFMRAFYTHYLSSRDAADALRATMVEASRLLPWSAWAGYYVAGAISWAEIESTCASPETK